MSTARSRGSQALKIVLSIAISAFFIKLTLRNVDLSEVVTALGKANYLYLLPYLGILTCIHFIRVYRWGILLEPVGQPGFARLNRAGAVGFMALVILPFRLGEFARPILIADARLRRSAAMASVVVERVVDGLSMAVVLIVALLFSNPVNANPKDIAWVRGGGFLVFGLFLGLLAFLVVAYLQKDLAVRLINRLARPLSPKLADKGSQMLEAFISGLRLVPDRNKVAQFFLLTVTYWGINGLGMAILARGFGLPIELGAVFAVLGILVVGVMIPAGPGMLGTFQGAIILGMQLFFPEVSQKGSIQAYAWVLWAAQFFQQVGFGLIFLAGGGISFSSLMGGSSDDEEPPAPTPLKPVGEQVAEEPPRAAEKAAL